MFSSLSTEPLEALSEIGRHQKLPEHAVVFSEGDAVDALYLIHSGSVEVVQQGLDGTPVRLAQLSAGDFFGEMALVNDAPRSATVRTLEPCDLFVIQRHHFIEMLSQTPRLIPAVFASVIDKIHNLNKNFLMELLEKQQLRDELATECYRSISLIATAANDSNNIEQAFQLVLDRLCAYIKWPLAHVYMTDAQDSESLLSFSIWFMKDPARFQQFRQLSEITCYKPGLGLPGYVLQHSKPVWKEDITDDLLCPRAAAAMQAGLKSGFAFPVLLDRKVKAVVEFFTDETLEPDRILLQATEQIGSQLGRAIERKLYQERLAHNAFHDPLTDLPNRALFLDHLNLSIGRARRDPNYLFAVMFVDLDRFKIVNDSLGHQAGDLLLKEVACRLRASVRATDTVARLGGDEFGVLLDDLSQLSLVPRFIERIRTEMREPVILDSSEFFTNASIGVALSSANYADADTALRDADTAMYRAKSNGPGNYAVFDSSMHEAAMKRLRIDNDLRRALERNELCLLYQPIVMVETSSPVGFEGLVRWNHPTLGQLGPMDFLPIAEDTDLIMPITEWVLETGCRQAKEWNRAFRAPVPISVSMNLAPKFFIRRDLFEVMRHFLKKLELDPSWLILEITEGQIVEDPPAVAKMLERLTDLGIRVHIDDFGTGYSSLSYLSTLRAAGLKIDQAFVAQIGLDERNHAIIRSTVSLSDHLGMHVIAEGVETEAQRAYLQSIRCKYAQGYLFGRPMDAASATKFLEQGLFPGMNEQFPLTEFNGFQIINS